MLCDVLPMNARLPNTAPKWIDPDAAPELTDADFERGTWAIAGKVVTRERAQAEIARRVGRPATALVRPMLSMRVDPDVLAKLRASGKGWQTRVNAVLRQAVEKGRV